MAEPNISRLNTTTNTTYTTTYKENHYVIR